MVQLKLSVEIVEFDLTHATIAMTVLNKRNRDGLGGGLAEPGKQPNSANLKMTLPELHIFLRAMLEFNGPLEVTTPDLDRSDEADDISNNEEETSFLEDKVLFGPSEAAE